MRLRRLLVTTFVGASVLMTGCGGSDPGAATGAGEDLPALRTSERPQRLTEDTALEACPTPDDVADERIASVVLPAAYDGGVGEDLPGSGRTEPEATCVIGIPNIDRYPRRGTSFLALTVPARLPLAEIAEAQSRESGVEVTRDGAGAQRARWRTPAGYAREAFEVVAVQSDGVRVALVTPRSASPAQRAAGREAWRMTLSSLAVRSAAAGDGDPDAESDDGPPSDDTTTLRDIAAQVDDARGYRRLTCAARSGASASLLVPRRLATTRRCSVARDGPLGRYDYDEENIMVEVGVDGPLWDAHTEARSFEAEGGDDSTSDLEYDADLVLPGRAGGLPTESLVYGSSYDGQPREYHVVQRGGVRITWQVRPDEWGPQIDELPTVLGSLEVRS